MRFGNKAFRTWFERVEQESEQLLQELLPEQQRKATIELTPYFVGSFGNKTRIDYGTGHEAAFVAFLCCLYILGFFQPSDSEHIASIIFAKYMQLIRRVQLVYVLEPAGSHGVWGLDDYQFVPFIWGAAQLIGNKHIKPTSFLKEDIVEGFSDDFFFLACIKFINQVKRGPFAEHSPILYDISGVPTWEKINSGLIKMYQAEVLDKLPVIQHFMFGNILSLVPATTELLQTPSHSDTPAL
eukprot:Colp12_sorted_trinity150504_noHs@28437